jgi:tellurium resistance protein TerD
MTLGLGWDTHSTDGAVDLRRVPPDIDKVAVCVTIRDAQARNRNFAMVSDAFVRCINANGNTAIARYDLSEDGSTETAMSFGAIHRNGGDWTCRAVGQGFKGGPGPLESFYGVNVSWARRGR